MTARADRLTKRAKTAGLALELRPMKNVGMRLATVTPFGAFPLIDYLIATSQSVGRCGAGCAPGACIARRGL
jgi:hypothetical protein